MAAPNTAAATGFGAVIVGLFGSFISVLTPFVTLALWQLSVGMFVFFFPIAAEQFTHATGITWPLLGVVCAFIRMASSEIQGR